jgi:hypothetical protein
MTTPRSRANVSRAAALSVLLALGACVRPQPRTAIEGRPGTEENIPLTIRFDNYATEHAHVYLVSDERQWLLGRVEPGARATLRIPEASLAASSRPVQLAVLTGEHVTPQVARNPRASFTIAQPASGILSQRWSFRHGQLTSLAGRSPRPDVNRL